jgi:hypothetical protein
VADIDGDGIVDVLAAGGNGSVIVLPGLGQGLFGDPRFYVAGRSMRALVVEDFDGDGWNDVAATVGEGVAIMVNSGPAVPSVEIDIKPDDANNAINPASRGVIPVAILGSADLDVDLIDDGSLRFGAGGASIAHLRTHREDVNLDGIVDLVAHFRTQETGVACGDESMTLAWETLDGQAFEQSDSILTVGCRVSGRPGARFGILLGRDVADEDHPKQIRQR